ncbi:MAG: helix-turn-helix domain-containing protein [Bacteroidota bacterium]
MIYQEYRPAPYLRPFIECYWSAVSDRPPFQAREALIPDGTIELMFNFGDRYQQWVDNQPKAIKGSHLIGIRESALFITQSSRQDFFSVRFKTGGFYPFFGVPAHLFASQIEDAQSVLGGIILELEDRLFEAPNAAERIALLDSFFLQHLNLQTAATDLTRHFLRASTQQPLASVGSLMEVLGTKAYKRTERYFKTATGLSPRHFLKIQRFNRSVQMMYMGLPGGLTEVALAAGYYDQAHFNRDFKALTYQSPRKFLRQQFKIVEVIQPALAERLSKTYNF